MNIRDCESLCLSDETVKVVGPFYMVSMPGELRDAVTGRNRNGNLEYLSIYTIL